MAAALACAALLAAVRWLPVEEALLAVLAWADGRGAWTAVLLGALWVPVAVALIPGSLLTLGTGFLLGVWPGLAVVSLGSTLGAMAAFLTGRTAARGWIERQFATRPRFRALAAAVARSGFTIVLLTRLSPIFPYGVLNYGYGVTRVRFADYALASWLGMLPGTAVYVVLGASARTLAEVTAGGGERGAVEWALLSAGLAATVAVAVLVARAARRALDERVGSDAPVPPS